MMHEIGQQYESSDKLWLDAPEGVGLDIMIVADNDGAPQEEVVADTSLLPAPDERGGEAPDLGAGDDIKKPPVDPPEIHQGTPEEDPEDGDVPKAQGALGELASVSEVAESPSATEELPAHLERITRSTHSLVVNRDHPSQELVDDAIGSLETGPPWTELRDYESHLNSRKVFVDDPTHPTLVAKFTDYAQEEGGRLSTETSNELAQAPAVRAIVESDAAQQIARDQGFAGISFVEPLLAVEGPGPEERAVVYPWQSGTVHSEDEGLHGAIGGSVPGSEMEAVNTVVDRMNGLFGINGVNSNDFGSEQIIVGEDGVLNLIDTEQYTEFASPEPLLAPNEQLTMARQEWSTPSSASAEIIVGFDQLSVTRGSDEVNPQLVSNTGEDGCVITTWNPFTREASMVNVQNRELGVEQLQELGRAIPTQMQPGVIAHLVGQASIEPEDGHRYMNDAGLAFEVGGVSQMSGVHIDRPTTVRLDVNTGKLETFDDRGEKTYSYTPPSVVDGA